MIRLQANFHALELRDPFTIARYTVSQQVTMIANITDGEVAGYGEATVNPYYNSTVIKLSESIARIQPVIAEVNTLIHPKDLWEQLSPLLQDDYFTLCAIDVAYWDYYARKHTRTLRSFWTTSDNAPLTSYTIGIDTIASMVAKINAQPWPLYKIKLGTDHDLEIIKKLREHTNSVFRVDANCAWDAGVLSTLSRKLKQHNVEFIEQPLPRAAWKAMRNLKNESALPLIADESCQREEDVLRCAEGFQGVNIKLMKCGGLTPALRMLQTAQSLRLKTMVGCMTESSVGISALVQLAPLLDYIDADGALLLAQDLGKGVQIENGAILFSESGGSGVVYNPELFRNV